MKSKQLILSAIALTVLIVGAATILIYQANAATLRATIIFSPSYYQLGCTPSNPWNVWISLSYGHNAVTEINQSTILLAGLYKPSGPGTAKRTTLIVPFNGYDVQAAILTAISHMTPASWYLVSLTVTGKTKSGTAFSGTGYIFVCVPSKPPP